MKLLDKLKNALFEEEYVEIEEKPKRRDIPKSKKIKERPIQEPKSIEEKPIAKKIVQPEKKEKEKEIEITEDEHLGESLAYNPDKENEFKFPMVSDNEFTSDDYLKEMPKRENKNTIKNEMPHYKDTVAKENKPYGLDEFDLVEHDYGAYNKKEEKTYFKPSPIISPIYGILDKNYTKDDIVPKREIRLTSSYARENINVDDVRKKAFGSLEYEVEKEVESIADYEEEDNQLLDLSSDNKTPEVKRVTVGDAEEYFEDLGLEYNVDYKDTSKEKASGRRAVEKHIENIKEDDSDNDIIGDFHEKTDIKIVDNSSIEEEDNLDDDNLFDLIDSMYDKE